MEPILCMLNDKLYDLRDRLDAFATCVENDPSCTCFYPYTIRETWPAEAWGYYRSTFGYASPDSPEFCYQANRRVCEKIKSCCCLPESEEYFKCGFQSGWMEYYGADSSCEYHGCEIFEPEGTIPESLRYRMEGSKRLDIVFGTIAVVILVFFLGAYVYFDRCRNYEGKGAEGGCGGKPDNDSQCSNDDSIETIVDCEEKIRTRRQTNQKDVSNDLYETD